jgi:hypothetical protein
MVAVCNVCPGASEAIVWFKFTDTNWIAYKSSTFPFAYEYIDNGNGTWTLNLRRRKPVNTGTYCPFFNVYNNKTNQWLIAAIPTQRFYGVPGDEELATFPSGSYNVWYMRGRDVCGNFGNWLILGSQASSSTFSYNTQMKLEKTSFSNWVTSTPSLAYANYYSSSASCNQCPSGWDVKVFEITGQGQPQIQISCTGKLCPPDTVCQCDCGKKVCCYGANGKPIYSYLK